MPGDGLNNATPSDASVQEVPWRHVVEVFEQEQWVITGAAKAANIGCPMPMVDDGRARRPTSNG